MDLSKQLENQEQRICLSTTGTLKMTMPGGQPLNVNEQHIIGHLPVGALVDSFQVYIPADTMFGADVTIDLGIPSNPTLFYGATVVPDGTAIANGTVLPVEIYASNEPLVATITGGAPEGVIHFNIGYTEVSTKAGKYTH